jgi:hypothetical protein
MDEPGRTRDTMKKTSTNKPAASSDGLQEDRGKKCRRIRSWLYETLMSRFSLNADWVQNHIASCPKCQRRFASVSRVNLALSLVKSQPHKLDLLMRANTQAIGVLKHSLREAPKTAKLKTMQPEPRLLEICSVHKGSAANVAACIAILFLMKTGIFYSVDTFQDKGKKAIKQYYINELGEDLARDIFQS